MMSSASHHGSEPSASRPSSQSRTSTTTLSSPSPWEANFERLKKFSEEHGHCNVPFQDPALRSLAKWTTRQKASKTLSADQKSRLSSIGYSWASKREKEDQAWMEVFQRLVKFQEEFHHCRVPLNYESDPELGTWVANQRKLCKQDKLRDYRKAKLDSVGFEWEVRKGAKKQKRVDSQGSKAYNKQWNEMFDKLKAFKEEHKHCNVPYVYEDRSLAMWVTTQRREFNQKSWYGANRSIKEDRKRRLDSIGFQWDNRVLPKKQETTKDSTTARKRKRRNDTAANQSSNNESSEAVSLLMSLRLRRRRRQATAATTTTRTAEV